MSEQGGGNHSSGRELTGPQNPQSLQDLLRMAVQLQGPSSQQQQQQQQQLGPLDPGRRRFLEEALSSMSMDVVAELTQNLQVLKEKMNEEEDIGPTRHEEALDNISDLVDHIDIANDFYKLGGFEVLLDSLESRFASVRWRAADVIAVCTQNNPECQHHALRVSLLPKVMSLARYDTDDMCRVKAFYAVSCITRDLKEGADNFLLNDGLGLVISMLQSNNEKLTTKASFLLSTLCSNHPDIKQLATERGITEVLMSLIEEEHKNSHEHIVSALLVLVRDNLSAQEQCRRPELQRTIVARIAELSSVPASLEEVSYLKELQQIVFMGIGEEER